MSDSFDIQINGQSVSATEGETILTVAERSGIEIPTLCHDPRLEPAGACRTCLVEVEGCGDGDGNPGNRCQGNG